MRILFENILSQLSISSLSPDANYPVANLYHPFLRRRYQSTENTDTITITVGQVINFIAFDYTNANVIVDTVPVQQWGVETRRTLEDGTPRILEDGTPRYMYEGNTGIVFPDVYIDTITIRLVGTEPVYLGGVGVGLAVTMPDPVNDWIEGTQDRSLTAETLYGQNLQEYIRPLRAESYRFRDVPRDEVNTIKEAAISVGRGRPIWIDPFEMNHDFLAPMYGVIIEPPSPLRNGRRYDFGMGFLEAR